ncbi:MAG: oxygen-independent coproporphyrinogen III oxidase [Xanthomonadales bacterium]|jgi:oxygen-independent coproporphyrinogen-3 oxidase|nr:oxygen-independent coproporphyrinogen III oxidase [Xanthomonadales bacterium]
MDGALSAELVQRYDQPAPRYVSYPAVPQFAAGFDGVAFADAARAAGFPAQGQGRALALYLHVPFCHAPCFYCGCSKVTTRDPGRADPYLELLGVELALKLPWYGEGRLLRQLHLGGGTPNFLEAHRFERLFALLARQLRLPPVGERNYSIELDPRVGEPGFVRTLVELGFSRISIGVQDFDREVQIAINRLQSAEQVRKLMIEARAAGIHSINLDLIYGLPKQTLEGFLASVEAVVELQPDRVALLAYQHMPEVYRAQRVIPSADLPDAALRRELWLKATTRLEAAGYQFLGLDHFALPHDPAAIAHAEQRLQRDFHGYAAGPDEDLLGLGVTAISKLGPIYAQNAHDLRDWEAALKAERIPLVRGWIGDREDELRHEAIQQLLCQGEIDWDRFSTRYGIDARAHFAAEQTRLSALARDGLVELQADRVKVTRRGRYLLRAVAMQFDQYLDGRRATRKIAD